MSGVQQEIAAAAARLVVEQGLDYGAAKHRVARELGRRVELPSNEVVEDAVREHLALFHADSQPAELLALRRLALAWMQRLTDHRPHLAGAVWRGTATRHSCLRLELYCDDEKGTEIDLINRGIRFEHAGGPGQDAATVLSLTSPCPELGEPVTILLELHDHDALRGALKPDSAGRSWRGGCAALERLLAAASEAPAGGGR